MADAELGVWVGGDYAGALIQHDAEVSFTYDAGYQELRYAPALSVSMPKIRTAHTGDVPLRWIDNLLPDNDDVRARWAAQFGERRATAFNLLRHMGQDCAGAVQVLPTDVEPGAIGDGDPVTDDDIEQRLHALRRDASAWTFADHGGRWSLGGAQGKFALARRPDGSWEEPTGRAASTHIFKIGVDRLEHSDVAEFVTMRTAALLGIRVAHSEIARFGSQTAMVSRRFDRRVDASTGTVTRLHQEDLCQALGLSRALKYESDGGPSVATISDLFATAVDPRDLSDARQLFAIALAYNWLVVGTDAHAKNFALLHFGPRVRLARLYDLTSAALLVPEREVQFESRLAMKIGGRYKIRDIAARHLARAGESIGVGGEWMLDAANRLVTGLPAAFEQAMDEAHAVLDDSTRKRFAKHLSTRVRTASGTLTAAAQDEPEAPSPDDSIWVPPHERNGTQIAGYWRTRHGRR